MDVANKQPQYLILDTSAFIFNYYYAMPNLQNSKQFPTGIIKGIDNLIYQLVNRFSETIIICVFDPKGGSFRNELYDLYKANRSKTPEELGMQIPVIKQYIPHTGVYEMMVENYEADDVIATLAHQLNEHSQHVWIASPDKDLMQLVNDNIFMFDISKNKLIDINQVKEKFNVFPNQIVDFLAIWGDASDNIPGVKGVGKVTASRLLNDYKTLDKIIENIDFLNPKLAAKFYESKEDLDISRKLVEVKRNVTLPMTIDSLSIRPPNFASLEKFYQEYEINGKFKE